MCTSNLDPFRMLAPSSSSEHNGAGDARCGCGCGCGCGVALTRLALPQDAMRRIGDEESAPPTQP